MPSPQGRSSRTPLDEAADQALATAAAAVGDRWSLLVVARLLNGPRRFGELLDELDGLAPNILAKRLARLEEEGLVVGEPYSTRPVRHAYRLTAAGADLAGPVRMLAGWGARRHGETPGARAGVPAHARCGTVLEARWFCVTCDEVVEPSTTAAGTPGDETDLVWL
ncbi:MAG TPA: helix-turn-helix domain-containing protein [Acidimicrobiales bacterium]|nr:helix-turn-helix domain-containing protein [Acidimicrobiales bacterium]